MSAASEKRIGIAYDLLSRKQERKDARESGLQESKKAYENSRDFYRNAIATEPYNHWVITQYLSILATPVLAPEEQAKSLAKQYGPWWVATRQIAEWQLRSATGDDRAWALSTLAELSLLGVVYSESDFDKKDAEDKIVEICQGICDAVRETGFQFCRHRDSSNAISIFGVEKIGKILSRGCGNSVNGSIVNAGSNTYQKSAGLCGFIVM